MNGFPHPEIPAPHKRWWVWLRLCLVLLACLVPALLLPAIPVAGYFGGSLDRIPHAAFHLVSLDPGVFVGYMLIPVLTACAGILSHALLRPWNPALRGELSGTLAAAARCAAWIIPIFAVFLGLALWRIWRLPPPYHAPIAPLPPPLWMRLVPWIPLPLGMAYLIYVSRALARTHGLPLTRVLFAAGTSLVAIGLALWPFLRFIDARYSMWY